MRTRYYTLDNSYDGVERVGDWILVFPRWILNGSFNLNLAKTCVSRWNPKVFALAHRSEGDHDRHEKPDFPIVLDDWHAASSRLRKLLTHECPAALEFLPFRTRTSTGGDITTDYAVMHYLIWLDAIDKKKSVLLPHETAFARPKVPGADYLLEKVVLKSAKLTAPICRIRGWSRYHVYREDIVGKLIDSGLTGMKFEEVETT